MLKGIFINSDRVQPLTLLEDGSYVAKRPSKSIDVLNKILKDWAMESVVFSSDIPKNCKYLHSTPNEKVFVIEEEPKFRTISLELNTAGLNTMSSSFYGKHPDLPHKEYVSVNGINCLQFYLFFPYVFYKINFTKDDIRVSIYMNYREMNSYYDSVYHLPMYNLDFHDRGNLACMGFNSEDYEYLKTCNNINLKIKYIINKFWEATFNDDIVNIINMYEYTIFGNYFEWELISKESPHEILKPPYNFPKASALMYYSRDIFTAIPSTFKTAKNILEMTQDLVLGAKCNISDSDNSLFDSRYIINQRDSFSISNIAYNKVIELTCGDKIKIPGLLAEYYQIEGFVCDVVTSEEFILLKDNEENIAKFELSLIVNNEEEISEQYLKDEKLIYECIELDGETIKVGDIITYTWNINGSSFSQLFEIKTFSTQNGVTQIVTNCDRILLLNKDSVKKFDLDKINYKIGESYLVAKWNSSFGCFVCREKTITNISLKNKTFMIELDGEEYINLIKSISSDDLIPPPSQDKFYQPTFVNLESLKPLPIRGFFNISKNAFTYITNPQEKFYKCENGYPHYLVVTVNNSFVNNLNMYSLHNFKEDKTIALELFNNILVDKKMKGEILSVNIPLWQNFSLLNFVNFKLGDIISKPGVFRRSTSRIDFITIKKFEFNYYDDLAELTIYDENDFQYCLFSLPYKTSVLTNLEINLCDEYKIPKDTRIKKTSSVRLSGFSKARNYKVHSISKKIFEERVIVRLIEIETDNIISLMYSTFRENFKQI